MPSAAARRPGAHRVGIRSAWGGARGRDILPRRCLAALDWRSRSPPRLAGAASLLARPELPSAADRAGALGRRRQGTRAHRRAPGARQPRASAPTWSSAPAWAPWSARSTPAGTPAASSIRSPAWFRSPQLFRTYQPLAPRIARHAAAAGALGAGGAAASHLQSAAVVEAEANALVNAAMLRGNLLARGNFDSLPIPFRAVATDLAHREPVVHGLGDLAQAVRASIAVPLLFAPELRDGRYLTDGGLSANMPVAVARAAGAERVIVSDATEHLRRSSTPTRRCSWRTGWSSSSSSSRPTRSPTATCWCVPTWTGSPASTSPAGTSIDCSKSRRQAADTMLAPLGLPWPSARPARALPTRIDRVPSARRQRSEQLALRAPARTSGAGDTLDPSLLRSRAARARRPPPRRTSGVALAPAERAIRSRSISRCGEPPAGSPASVWPTTTSSAAGCGPGRSIAGSSDSPWRGAGRSSSAS